MSDSQDQIAFEQLGLGSVLRQSRLFVPPNQREYAWTDREVTQLLQDYAKAINDGEPAYFLGTVVTIPRTDGSLEVVDGQQRLATTAILLAAIRDYLVDRDDILVEALNNEFLTGIDRAKRSRIPKLRLNVDDNEYFQWIIARNESDQAPEPVKDSHALLDKASKTCRGFVRKIVATLDPTSHGDHLNDWVSFVERRAIVVLLRVPNDANAYKMFETLNDRGLRTSQADLIKNYLFGRSGERILEVQNRWSYMRGTLESLEEENITVDFLRHALIAIRGYTRESEVYDAVQENAKSEHAAVGFASQLESLATSYVATFNPEHEKWNNYPNSCRRSIEVINLLNIRPMRPLLLAVSSSFVAAETAGTFQFCVALGVRLLIASSTRSGSVELPLAAAAKSALAGEITSTEELKAQLNGVTPTGEEFRTAFETARVSKAQLARYYLRSLEMAARNEPEPWFLPTQDPSVINLEHVLPKKPEGNWPLFTDDEANIYVNRLGNQALLQASTNSDLKSVGFVEKRPVFNASEYILTSQIGDYADWSPQEIADRQRGLAHLAPTAWPI